LPAKGADMKCFFTISLLLQLFGAHGQDSSSSRPGSFALQLNQDNTFNFYPAVYGSLPLKKFDLTFYAIFWTTPVFANVNGTGSFMEVGVGLNFFANNITIQPSIGIGSGIFTNGRDLSGRGRPTVLECIVPGLTSFFRNKGYETEFFAAIYANLRKQIEPITNYILFWFLPGVRITHTYSMGFHYEQFRDITNGIGTYARYGLYGKITFKRNYDLRFSAGLNYTHDLSGSKEKGDFYKLSVYMPF
jgi:hypothetical protein